MANMVKVQNTKWPEIQKTWPLKAWQDYEKLTRGYTPDMILWKKVGESAELPKEVAADIEQRQAQQQEPETQQPKQRGRPPKNESL